LDNKDAEPASNSSGDNGKFLKFIM
jgi:hypothetical protein